MLIGYRTALTAITAIVVLLTIGAAAAEEPAKVLPPTLKKFVHAEYPEEQFEARQEGTVGMLVEIDGTGAVVAVEVVQSAGAAFDAAAVVAVEQFEFEPATLDGAPLPVRIGYNYHFKLEKKEMKKTEGQSLSGRLKEKGVGLPVIGAEVALLEPRLKTTSNRKGRFGFKEVLPGSYTMVVIHPEFKKQEAKVDFVEGKDLEIKLLLEPLLENPYEIVVKGKKEESVVTRYVLEQRTLETVPGTFGDPVRVVETLPGFARAPFGAGVLVIRGSLPTQSRTYIDGIEVPILLHFLGGPSIISASFMDSIEYYPGSFPVTFRGYPPRSAMRSSHGRETEGAFVVEGAVAFSGGGA